MNKIIKKFKNYPIKNILIVDDEESMRTLLVRSLSKNGFVCEEACDAEEALGKIAYNNFDLIFSDISMPGMDGIEFLQKVKSHSPDIDFIIMTGYASEYSYMDIMDAGATDYMSKPFNLNSAIARINRIAREKKNLIDLKKSNQELCKAIDRANQMTMEAKEASKAKTFFLASMSHEIRTPLNGIVGYTDMLMDTNLDEEQQSFLKNAKNSCETLLSVVNDILDFSKVEAGKLSLDSISFDPEILCFDTIDAIRTKVDESNVELICSVADSVPAQVMGDPHRFRQILLNLLGNAVKFTHHGIIKVSLDSQQVDDNKILLTICVKDSGIGIPKSKLEGIFEPFIQSEDDITSRYGGTGLGLAISKNIAKKMGGNLWAESKENYGSSFYFSSRLKMVPNKDIKRIRPAQLKGKKVLLSNTSGDAYKILEHEFELAGMKVEHVDFKDLKSHLNHNQSEEYDIAVIDFGRVVKSFNTDVIKQFSFIVNEPPCFDFIACSVPMPGITDAFAKAGFKGFLPKPIARRKLFEMVAYVIGIKLESTCEDKTEQEIVTTHVLSENKKYNASILLVEDNLVNQKMTSLMLSKAGYMIEIAENGQVAVEKYTSNPDAYDLIFMDINMPKMNGFEATQLIRSHEKEELTDKRIPILALTANVLDDFKTQCYESGMDDFLTKPIKRDLVLNAILEWVTP